MTVMILRDAKVLKHFGAHPERGKPMRMLALKRVTVGVRWSLPKQDYVPDDDVLVTPSVALKPVSHPVKGCRTYHIQCEPRHLEKVTMWLADNCM